MGRHRGRTRVAASKGLRLNDLPTERKYVTLLRVDIVRSTDVVASLELDQWIARLKPALDVMHAAVRDHGGVVCQLLGDGVFAVFGAPLADDRHATVACHSALDLMQRMAALRDDAIKIRIGLHSGFVAAGVHRGDWSRAYEVVGPPLHLADRLQGAADPGQILVSDETRRLADPSIVFEADGRRDLKGFADPIDVYRVVGVRRPAESAWLDQTASLRFFGRSREHALLKAATKATAEGSGSLVAVVGEPGVGKSRLAREAFGTLTGAGWACATTECNTIMGNSPFALARDLVGKLLQFPAISSPGADLLLPPAERAAIDILLTRPYDADVWGRLGRRARERALIGAVQTLLATAARTSPILLLIEDLQWCDDTSMPLIEALAGFVPAHQILLAVTARTGGLPDWLRRHVPAPIILQPLDVTGATALIDDLLGISPGLAVLKQRILDHTGRLPLFIKEVCHRLAEMGAVTGDPGQFRLASMPLALDVPPTVHGVIAARVDRLLPVEKRVLQTAAVIGVRSPARLLKTVARLPETVFVNCIKKLEAAELLMPTNRDDAVLFSFPHELVRQVSYDALLGPAKIILHAGVLTALESGMTDGVADLPGALVHHAEMSQNWERAADHAEAVADSCVQQGALAQAARYFERAITVVDRWEPGVAREERAIDLRIDSRNAVSNSGQVRRWISLASEAEGRAKSLGDEFRLTSAMISHAAALNFFGPVSDAFAIGKDAIQRAERLGDECLLTLAEFGLGQSAHQAGRNRDAIALIGSARHRLLSGRIARPLANPVARMPLISSFVLTRCYFALGDVAGVEEHHRFLEETGRRKETPLAGFAAAFSLGVLQQMRGELSAAEHSLENASSLARQHDLLLFAPVATFQRGLVLFWQGNMAKARSAFAEAEHESNIVSILPTNLRSRLYIELTSDQTDIYSAGQGKIEALYNSARQQGYEGIAAEALICQGVLLRRTGEEPEAAYDCLQRGYQLAFDLGLVTQANWASGLLGMESRSMSPKQIGDI